MKTQHIYAEGRAAETIKNGTKFKTLIGYYYKSDELNKFQTLDLNERTLESLGLYRFNNIWWCISKPFVSELTL